MTEGKSNYIHSGLFLHIFSLTLFALLFTSQSLSFSFCFSITLFPYFYFSFLRLILYISLSLFFATSLSCSVLPILFFFKHFLFVFLCSARSVNLCSFPPHMPHILSSAQTLKHTHARTHTHPHTHGPIRMFASYHPPPPLPTALVCTHAATAGKKEYM